MKNFHDLFVHELKDVYSAEIQTERLLPELARAATTPNLKEAFTSHHRETQEQIKRLESIAREHNINLKAGHECRAMKLFAEEIHKILQADYPAEVKDAALISAMQRVEHYEITLYGTLKAFARHLGFKDAEKKLNQTSKEEGAADKKLSQIAEGTLASSGVNEKAMRKSA